MELLIERIDEWLNTTCAERSVFSRSEVADMLLDLRLLAAAVQEPELARL